MSKTKKNKASFAFALTLISLLSVVLLLSVSFLIFTYYYKDRIFPNIYVANVNLGGLTEIQARALLTEKIKAPQELQINAKEKTISLSLSSINFEYDLNETAQKAYETYRDPQNFRLIPKQLASFFNYTILPPVARYDNVKLDEYLDVTESELTQAPEYPTATLASGIITVTKGKGGEEIDKSVLKETILENLENLNFSAIQVTYQQIDPALTDTEANEFQGRAEKLIGKSVVLSYEFTTYKLTNQKLLSILNPRDTIFEPKAKELITKEIAPLFNRPAQNAAFKFEDGRVQEFKPAKDGIKINEDQLMEDLRMKVQELGNSESKELALNMPVQTEAPTVTTKEVNELGINELIGRGTSLFKGSIASRVFNVGHASSKLNGVLIPPNTVFSFNDTVGDVSKLTGYKEAYIIQNGRTILGDGGGLCQVSTTLFRAALNAGLPIIDRRPHAYRVGYYEQDSGPGLDATVYVPTTDFKFKNDTPNTILIQTIFDPKAMTLAFELYGTKDGRVATVTKPVVTNVIAPAEDQYIDDPTLPTGKVNQVEHKAWGATVTFDYKVTRNGEEIYTKKFVSKYQPWKAVYMRGTGPV
jgi:vancomycin resistance protein YoaR